MTIRVLLADDEALVRAGLRMILESEADIEVVGDVEDGEQAAAATRRLQPDLVLMDIQLPEVSGIEVTKWLKEADDLRHIPVIAVTAFAMKGDEEKIKEGGCEAYISKPISVLSFLQTIDGFLKKAS